jgi:hypothetical protein
MRSSLDEESGAIANDVANASIELAMSLKSGFMWASPLRLRVKMKLTAMRIAPAEVDVPKHILHPLPQKFIP